MDRSLRFNKEIVGKLYSLRRARTQRGHSFIELAIMATLLAVLAAFCVDIGLLLLGAAVNDSACRDGARAAAQADTADKATANAKAAIAAHQTDGNFVGRITLDETAPGKGVDYQVFAFTPGKSPNVTVATQCVVKIPAPILFMGAEFLKDGKMTFRQRYQFPVINTPVIDLNK